MSKKLAGASITKEEFSAIYDSHAEKIYRFIYYKTLHRETAEDLTSHTFLNALENMDQFDPKRGSMTIWLYRIARNLVIDHFRKKRNTIDIDDVWDLASSDDPAGEVHENMQLDEIKTALAKLPREQRDIVILRIWEDLPYKEIAAIMDKNESACKMMFSRVMARLRTELTVALCIFLFLRGTLE
jgi:RNA polymerase sigma factor (sigma-70 family)